jgi:hypothetical protein
MSFVPKTTKKGGSNLTTDLANLSVPFGLVLAQKSLEKYLTKKTPSTTKKTNDKTTKRPTTARKATVSGGKKSDGKKSDGKKSVGN